MVIDSAEGEEAEQKSMPFAEAFAGAGSGALTVLLLHPLDTLKTVLQSSSGNASVRAVASRGLVPLYRGAGPAMVGSAGSWALYFHSFYALRRLGSNGPLPDGARDFAAAAAAGCITAAITNPIWMVKTRMQLAGRYRHAGDAVRTMARDEGLASFYRGLVPSLWLVSNAAIQFALYEKLKSIAEPDGRPSAGQTAVASAISKLVASTATYPLQVVRTRMQEPEAGLKGYSTFPRTARLVALREGPRSFYRGIFANLVRVVPQASLTLVLYESILSWAIR